MLAYQTAVVGGIPEDMLSEPAVVSAITIKLYEDLTNKKIKDYGAALNNFDCYYGQKQLGN